MEHHKRYLPYESRFLYFSNFVEKIFSRIIVIGLILLLLFQFLLSFNEIREILVPLERIEGNQSFGFLIDINNKL